MKRQLSTEIFNEASTLEDSTAPLTEFTNLCLEDEQLQQLIEYKDPYGQLCTEVTKYARSLVSTLNITWDEVNHLGWKNSNKNVPVNTRLWNTDA